MLRKTSALPSCTPYDDVSLCLGRIIGTNSVDFRVECFTMTPFGCRVTCTSRAVMCVSTETRKNVTNHRGQSRNKQSGFEHTCPTCLAHSYLYFHIIIIYVHSGRCMHIDALGFVDYGVKKHKTTYACCFPHHPPCES